MKPRILVVEDDASIRLGLKETLRSERYEVSEVANGAEAASAVKREKPDLILLDVMLPGKSGYDVCRELRAGGVSVPIVMLTAKGQEIEKVVGLKLGADDYVTKPFGVQELLARIAACLRRAGRREVAPAPPLPDEVRFGEVVLRPAALRGTASGRIFALTGLEMKVLALLYREAGNVVSRDRLLDEVWGEDYDGTTRTVDQVILKLRQKLEAEPASPRHLLTVHGAGYRLET